MKNQGERKFVKESILVYLIWLGGQVVANSLLREPGTKAMGEIIYYLAVTLSAVIIPLKLCSKHGIAIRFHPKKEVHIKAILSGVLLILTMFILGIFAMEDDGLTLGDLKNYPWSYHLSFFPIFLPTMAGYCILWFGYFYQGLLKASKGRKSARFIAIGGSSLVYSLYHFTSLIDQYQSYNELWETIMITLFIGLLVGIHLIYAKSLLAVFISIYLINYFVFFADTQYHVSGYETFYGPIILLFIFGAFFLLSGSPNTNRV